MTRLLTWGACAALLAIGTALTAWATHNSSRKGEK
jgi:hypothetical protein